MMKKIKFKRLACSILALAVSVTSIAVFDESSINKLKSIYADELTTQEMPTTQKNPTFPNIVTTVLNEESSSVEQTTVDFDDNSQSNEEDIIASTDFQESDCENGEVYYTLTGGVNDWNPLAKTNQMKETIWDGVYSINIDFDIFEESSEWKNRFGIYRINDVTVNSGGWTGSICLGTDIAEDNQTTFRVENSDAIESATVYYDENTGAVVILSDGDEVDYRFSWVGYDNERQYTTVSEFATCGYLWPEDKVKVEEIPDIEAGYNDLLAKVTGRDLADEKLYMDGKVKYTVVGGCSPMPWTTTSSANEMRESAIKGVYTFKMNIPAYDEATEWLNRFKIIRLDDITYEIGWVGSLCLGTTTYEDNQTWLRIEEDEAMEVTVYFRPATGAVVILDSEGNEIDYKFSWVGYDNETQYTTVYGFETCGYVWPADKLKVDYIPKMQKLYNNLLNIIKKGSLETKLTRIHFQNTGEWDEVGACVYYGNDTTVNIVDNCFVTVNKEDGTVKKLYPGAYCFEEKIGWNICYAEVTSDMLLDGLTIQFNNFVGDSQVNEYLDETDIEAIIASGINTTATHEKIKSEQIYIDSNHTIFKDGNLPSDIYIKYGGGNPFVTAIAPEDYTSAEEAPKIVVDGVYYNSLMTELIAYPTDKQGAFVIPDSVEHIRDGAFVNAKGLTELTIPQKTNFNVVFKSGEEVKQIFEGCNNLTSINVEDENENFTSIDGVLYDETGSKLLICPNAKTESYVIPKGINEIGKCAFLNCSNLETVSIPVTVYDIEENAFKGCPNLLIKGSYGSVAEEYAKEHNIRFEISGNFLVTYHFYNALGWENVGAWAKQSIDWSEECLPLNLCVVKDETSEPIWPGAKMEDEGNGWYKITCDYSAPEKGTMLVFNNYVGDAKPGDTTSEADIQKLRDAGIVLSDVKEKEQTQNIMIKRNQLTKNEYWINWDGNYKGPQITYGKSDMFLETAPDNYIINKEEDSRENKYVDGVLYNWNETELIKYPEEKEGEFIVPDTVLSIRDEAFKNCKKLTGITISENTRFNIYSGDIISRENCMFYGCESLKYINVNGCHPNYKTIDGVLFDKTGTVLLYYPRLRGLSYIIPEIIKLIETFAFSDCEKIELSGTKDSYAKSYAKENNITFHELSEKVSSNNKVSILANEDKIRDDSILDVKEKEIENKVFEDKVVHSNIQAEDVKYEAYDINLLDEKGNKIQPGAVITVKIECPSEFVGDNCKVYYIDDTGKIVDMEAFYENGFIYFSTNHFSTYIVTETELEADDKEIVTVIKGDVNYDGEIDIKDSALIKRHLAGIEVEINLDAADVNGDGEVSIKDSALVKRQLAGW